MPTFPLPQKGGSTPTALPLPRPTLLFPCRGAKNHDSLWTQATTAPKLPMWRGDHKKVLRDRAEARRCRQGSPPGLQGAGGASTAAPGSPARKFPARGQVRLPPVVSAAAGSKAGSNKGPDPRSASGINAYNFPSLNPILGTNPSLCPSDVKHSEPTDVKSPGVNVYTQGTGPGPAAAGMEEGRQFRRHAAAPLL